MPVGEMLRRMDSRELSEWQAYFELQGEAPQEQKVDAYSAFNAWFGHKVTREA